MWIKVVSLRPIKKNTVMTNDRLKGFTYGALAAASYGLNPLFALPLYGAGMKWIPSCSIAIFLPL